MGDATQDIELFKAAIDASKATLKTGLLTNGAAAATLISLCGNFTKATMPITLIRSLSLPIGCFGGGVVLCLWAFGGFVLAQKYFYQSNMHNRNERFGNFMQQLCYVLVGSSFALFTVGCVLTFLALRNFSYF